MLGSAPDGATELEATMALEMTIDFPGGKRVDAHLRDTVIHTDQSKENGGDESAPEPYAYFLASIGTCAGIYVLGFCRSRDLPTEGIRLVQRMEWDAKGFKLEKVEIDIEVPPSFPEKYHKALVRAADKCAVKRTIFNPPEFLIETRVSG